MGFRWHLSIWDNCCIMVLVEFQRILNRHLDCSSSLLTKVLTKASVGLGIVTRWVLMVVVFQAVMWKYPFCWHLKAAEQGKICRAVNNGGCSLLRMGKVRGH